MAAVSSQLQLWDVLRCELLDGCLLHAAVIDEETVWFHKDGVACIRVDNKLFLASVLVTHLVTEPSLAKEAVVVCLAATVATATSRTRSILLAVAADMKDWDTRALLCSFQEYLTCCINVSSSGTCFKLFEPCFNVSEWCRISLKHCKVKLFELSLASTDPCINNWMDWHQWLVRHLSILQLRLNYHFTNHHVERLLKRLTTWSSIAESLCCSCEGLVGFAVLLSWSSSQWTWTPDRFNMRATAADWFSLFGILYWQCHNRFVVASDPPLIEFQNEKINGSMQAKRGNGKSMLRLTSCQKSNIHLKAILFQRSIIDFNGIQNNG